MGYFWGSTAPKGALSQKLYYLLLYDFSYVKFRNISEFKTREFKPREKKRRSCKSEEVAVEEVSVPPAPKFAMKDTELMKLARELYERDMDKPTLEPLPTHTRILGYVRPCLYKTGISEYQQSIARLAYEMVRDDRIPRYYAHNGCRPRWGLPPEGTRQPELDGAPYDGERLY
ncbi:jg21584 [Pararge aegeria aegeria]|uniref:Jg21584 protein n=1 Tax=Pararge aegeria aegeria TaxID=348720 RepID=A0A8S4SB47_9NEOP|nr:jg21584 [Pararge aegeria aegeria]